MYAGGNSMSIRKCINQVKRAGEKVGVKFSDEEIQDIMAIIERKLTDRDAAFNGLSPEQAIKKVTDEINEDAKLAARVAYRNRLINVKRHGELKRRIAANPSNPSKALSDIMVGSLKSIEEGRVSVDAQAHSIMTNSVGKLAAELERKGLLELFTSGQLDNLIYREMFDGFGTTGNKRAEEIARSIQRSQKVLLNRKNRAGAVIRELKNYVVRQNHDPMLMRDAGFDKWKTDILPLLDKELTFKNIAPDQTEDSFLRGVYDSLVSGMHQKTTSLYSEDGLLDPVSGFTGQANLAKKLSAERKIHFLNGEGAKKYADLYSRMSLSEAVINGITHDAQTLALMETFGTNPRAMFDRLVKEMTEENKGNLEILDKINERVLNTQFAELDGTTRARGASRPVFFGVDFAGIAASWRMLQNMSKLGFATISSISDVVTKAAFINANTERGLFASYARAFGDVFEGLKTSKERKEMSYLLNVGIENLLGDVHARFGSNDSGPGMIAKAHQFFFKVNGMQWWNNSQKTGIARMLAADLANYSRRSWTSVPVETRNLLAQYGIREQEWGLFKTLDLKAADNRNYLVPSAAQDVSNDLIDPIIFAESGKQKLQITDKMRQEYKDKLETKIATYLTDSADIAIPTPGARERAIMNQGLPRGTVMGEAIRAIMQLKGFPITYLTKGISRQYYNRGGGLSGVYGISQMIVGMTVMGYLAMSTKEILKGREPKDVFSDDIAKNAKTLAAAAAQGGGFGLFGDFIFGEFNRYGQSLTQTVAGPTFGAIDDIFRTMHKFARGDEVAAEATKFAMRNTPFVNLFYTKAALDYLVLHGFSEMANPGYLRRMEKRFKDQGGQDFFFPPSQYAVQF